MKQIVRMLILSGYLLLPAQDERLLRWNQFAHDANEFINTVHIDKEHYEKDKHKLEKEWEAVYPLL